jgi:hypothetical protein
LNAAAPTRRPRAARWARGSGQSSRRRRRMVRVSHIRPGQGRCAATARWRLG